MIVLKVLTVLAANADRWFDAREIAPLCITSRRYAWEALKQLEADGFIECRGDREVQWRTLVIRIDEIQSLGRAA